MSRFKTESWDCLATSIEYPRNFTEGKTRAAAEALGRGDLGAPLALALEGLGSYLTNRGHRVATARTLGIVNAAFCSGGLPRFAASCIVLADPRGHGLSLSANE